MKFLRIYIYSWVRTINFFCLRGTRSKKFGDHCASGEAGQGKMAAATKNTHYLSPRSSQACLSLFTEKGL